MDKLLLGGIISDCVTSIPIEKDLMGSDEIRIFDDHRFVGINTTSQSEGMFFVYDSQRKSMKWIEPVPKVKGIDDRHKVYLHNGVFSVNSSKKSIVYATRYYDQVLFYDLSGKLQKQHVFSPLEKPELSAQQITPVMGSFLYAVSVLATSEYCFVHRLGGRSIPPEPPDSSRPYTPIPTQLLIFNWEGVLIHAFNEYIGARFCYDEEFGNFYTLEAGRVEDDPHVIVRKYHIGEYLKVN